MKHLSNRFKKGAASFYIVAFSTLILVIIAASFAMVIISEVTRTSNDDLSQSAYDAALAGVEDAKLAYLNYKKCVEQGATEKPNEAATGDVTCGSIIYWIEHPESQDCGTVARILGRDFTGDGVQVSETTEGNNRLAQYYTCVKINTILQDYRANLSASMPAKVVKVELDGVDASQIEKVKLSWYSGSKGTTYNFTNVNNGGVSFPPLSSKVATPPTISLSLIQTGKTFNLSDFEKIDGNTTNRGTIYLVPTKDKNLAGNVEANNGIGIYKNKNIVEAEKIVESNNHSVENYPLITYCDTSADSDFVCSATINLPKPLSNAVRSNDTFMFVVSLPYGQPDTDFALEFLCGDNNKCYNAKYSSGSTGPSETVYTKGIQVSIDSTGRANDLFRRVEAHLESTDTGFPYPFYAIQVLKDSDGQKALEKNLTVTREYGDYSEWFSSSNY